ncbi:MAG: Type 1 glutamine amidotransferase-like domain-containing protein [Candidatus Dadabacteria bacterium]
MPKIIICLFLLCINCYGQSQTLPASNTPVKTIFAYGGEINKDFLRYVIRLTKKTEPKVCFLPTAAADNPYYTNYWFEMCFDFAVKPSIQRMFVSSSPGQKSFEENLLGMDAIIVGGGNTLNMIAIWKAQGVDTVLRKAYEKGIILAGGSAGSLCWFKNGLSDSRPQKLSVVECLGFINASHCPHYSSEKTRRPLYLESVLKGEVPAGYACDDLAGMLFRNGSLEKAVTLDKNNNVYYVSVKDGKIEEQKISAELIK